MPFWTSSYGLQGDPYAEMRLTVGGSRLQIPLGGGDIELQELGQLNKFEALGKQEEALDFAAELNTKFASRGTVKLVKNSEGQWIRTGEDKPGLGGYEYEGGGQEIELTEMDTNVFDLDVELGDNMAAEPNFDELPELEQLEGPELGVVENVEAQFVGQVAEDVLLEAEQAEDYVVLARQVALIAAEAAADITEVSVLGVLGSVASGAASAAIMIGMTLAGRYLLRWIAKRHMDKTSDDDPMTGLVGYFILKNVWYPMRIDIVEHKKWLLHFKDLTGFWRPYRVKVGDERIHIIKPPRKWPFDHKPLVTIGKRTVKMNFFPEFPIGTRIKRLDIFFIDNTVPPNQREGVITRGMIKSINGYNPDGTYDKYEIKVTDGTTVYIPVNRFQVYAQNFKPKTRPHGLPNFAHRPKTKQPGKIWSLRRRNGAAFKRKPRRKSTPITTIAASPE